MKKFPKDKFTENCSYESVIEFNDLHLIKGGGHTHPGSSHVEGVGGEWGFFQKVLNNVDSEEPVMLEIGCLWALWSMAFKQRFPNGESIVVEPGNLQLACGLKNFELNEMDCTYYHGHCGGDTPNPFGGFNNSGDHISIHDIKKETNTKQFDILHMDSQGAEFAIIPEIRDLIDEGVFKNLVIFTHGDPAPVLSILNSSPAVEVVELGQYDDPYVYARAKCVY